MKDIKLWKTNFRSSWSFSHKRLEEVHGPEVEVRFTETLIQCPGMIVENLKLLCGKSDTHAGHTELLGVDREGRLVAAELEKGTLTGSSVTQIIDYTSYLYAMNAGELAQHVQNHSGTAGIKKIDDFPAWYQTIFQAPFSAPQDLKMILVGLDFDHQAGRMVKFLGDRGIDISLILFHAFQDEKEFVIAMQEIYAPGKIVTRSAKNLENRGSERMQEEPAETSLQDLIKRSS